MRAKADDGSRTRAAAVKSDGLSVERKLKLLTANADDYFWHAGLEVEKRSKEARLKLRRSVLRGLTEELEKFERVTDETNRELRAAQVAAVGRKASAEPLLDRALASMANLKETALALTRRMDEWLK
jgi:hypothetical protein